MTTIIRGVIFVTYKKNKKVSVQCVNLKNVY